MQEYRLVRANRKTVSVRLDEFGVLSVYAPKDLPKKKIDEIVKKKENWIARTRARLKFVELALPPERLHGYSFYLFGEPCEILETDERAIRYDGVSKKLFVPKNTSHEDMRAWLSDLAHSVMLGITEKYAKIMRVEYKSLKITSVKSYWGGCTRNDDIRYCFRIIYAPSEVMEYLAVHELAHILHKNHSRWFWAEVEKYMPNWYEKRKWIRDRRILFSIF